MHLGWYNGKTEFDPAFSCGLASLLNGSIFLLTVSPIAGKATWNDLLITPKIDCRMSVNRS